MLKRLFQRKEKYVEASFIALKIGHPRKLKYNLDKLLEKGLPMKDFVKTLSKENKGMLWNYLIEWNRNNKNDILTQTLANLLLKQERDIFFKANNTDELNDTYFDPDTLSLFQTYSNRHFRRIVDLEKDLVMVDHLLDQLNLL